MCAKNFDHMTLNARDRNAGRGGLRVVYPADRDLQKPWRPMATGGPFSRSIFGSGTH